MAQRKRRKRGKRTVTIRLTLPQAIVLGLALFCLIVGLNLGMENGTASVPTWNDLYQALGFTTTPVETGELSDQVQAVHFIDVGQGDATLLQSGDTYCLVDAGEPDSKEALLSYLEQQGVDHLALLVMSHPHADHIGSMKAVLEQVQVDHVLLPDLDKAPYPTTRTFEKVMETIERLQIPTTVSQEGQTFQLGEGTLEVRFAGIETDNYNDLSQILYYHAPGLSVVLSGDAEKDLEQQALEQGVVPKAQVYKAAHHGSNTSNSMDYLEAIQPQWIVVSCGKDNSYGHPHKEPMQRFGQIGAEILRTDQNGSVVIAATENGLQSYTANAA